MTKRSRPGKGPQKGNTLIHAPVGPAGPQSSPNAPPTASTEPPAQLVEAKADQAQGARDKQSALAVTRPIAKEAVAKALMGMNLADLSDEDSAERDFFMAAGSGADSEVVSEAGGDTVRDFARRPTMAMTGPATPLAPPTFPITSSPPASFSASPTVAVTATPSLPLSAPAMEVIAPIASPGPSPSGRNKTRAESRPMTQVTQPVAQLPATSLRPVGTASRSLVPAVLTCLGFLAVGAALALVMSQVADLRSEVAADHRSIERLTLLAESTARREPPPPAAPVVMPVEQAAAPAAEEKVAASPVAPVAAAIAPQVAPVDKPATPRTDAVVEKPDTARLNQLLLGRPLQDWRMLRLLDAARHAVRIGKMRQDELAAMDEYINTHGLPSFSQEELAELQLIHGAQQVLVDCKLIDRGGFDLQLTERTRTMLGNAAKGSLACKSESAAHNAAFDYLKAELAGPEWRALLDDAHAISVATAPLRRR